MARDGPQITQEMDFKRSEKLAKKNRVYIPYFGNGENMLMRETFITSRFIFFLWQF